MFAQSEKWLPVQVWFLTKGFQKPFLSNECCCSGEVAGDDGGGRSFPLCLGCLGWTEETSLSIG